MANSLKLVIFDCDGTLVDSQHVIVAAMHEAYRGHRVPVPARERLLSIVGLSLPEAFRTLGEGHPDYPVTSLIERYRTAHAALLTQAHAAPLFPDARETVEALAQRPATVLGIATGKSRRGVEGVLGRHGLLGYFLTIKTADDAPSKPDPTMVLEAMRETGAAPADTVVVGDTAFDMAMARAAGAAGIGVVWGYHPPEALHAAGAFTVIEEFPTLLPTLDHLWLPQGAPAHPPV
jgi:phosphoglycolate phosphatase